MEEKTVTKISLSTFFLILAIITIIVMGILIYKLNNDKLAEIQKSSELQSQVNTLSETVSDLQEKINRVSETISSNTSVSNTMNTSSNVNNTNTINTTNNNTTNNSNNNSNSSFTDTQVKLSLANYLELQAHAGCDSLLEKLTENGKLKYDESKTTFLDDGKLITNIKFSDYKNAMLNYVSKAEFEKNWTDKQFFSENSNGYLTKVQGGGDLRVYTIKSITKISDLTYTAKVTSVVDDNEYFEENTYTFVIASYNGNCVIDSLK